MASRFAVAACHVPVLSLLLVSLAFGAERAASVEYEFVGRPAGLPADLEAPRDGMLRFLAITAIDGVRVDAVLSEPRPRPPAGTVIISVHGSGERYDVSASGIFVRRLPLAGYAVLAINTRQSGERINTDNFFDVRRDIEAAVYTARALGYRVIVLHGHSLGNIQVQYYAANNWDLDLKAVLLTGMFANVPWKSRHMLIQNEEAFATLHNAALQALRENREGDVLPHRMRRTLSVEEPVTAEHFLTYRAEESSAADGTYWIRRIPRPILMVRDGGDTTIAPFEPYMLLSAAKASGSLVPSITFVLLPNPKGPNPGGHSFTDNQQPLVDTTIAWLRELKLQ